MIQVSGLESFPINQLLFASPNNLHRYFQLELMDNAVPTQNPMDIDIAGTPQVCIE